MANSKLPTNFQLNIVIFEDRESLQTLILSLHIKGIIQKIGSGTRG